MEITEENRQGLFSVISVASLWFKNDVILKCSVQAKSIQVHPLRGKRAVNRAVIIRVHINRKISV